MENEEKGCFNCLFVECKEDEEPCANCMHGEVYPNDNKDFWQPERGIKDSGERTEFPTGAVRDMHEGKGRFDLLPMYAIWEVAKHCERGAQKYGERNVDKGIPQHSLIDSALRHLIKYVLGYTDENHLTAACWNVLWALNQEFTHPELNDLPKGGGKR